MAISKARIAAAMIYETIDKVNHKLQTFTVNFDFFVSDTVNYSERLSELCHKLT